MHLVFTSMLGESYRRRLRSFLLYLCYVFRALINSLSLCVDCSKWGQDERKETKLNERKIDERRKKKKDRKEDSQEEREEKQKTNEWRKKEGTDIEKRGKKKGRKKSVQRESTGGVCFDYKATHRCSSRIKGSESLINMLALPRLHWKSFCI